MGIDFEAFKSAFTLGVGATCGYVAARYCIGLCKRVFKFVEKFF